MIPYQTDGDIVHYNDGLERLGTKYFAGPTKHPVECCKMFYADNALDGNGYHVFGYGLALFGEDYILENENL